MQENRIRLDATFKENLRNVDPRQAVNVHLAEMWRDTSLPSLDDIHSIGDVTTNIYSSDSDYLIVVPNGYILVDGTKAVSYGEFDGYSSGNKSHKQIIDGLERTSDYQIYKIKEQREKDTSVAVPTLMYVDSVNLAKRAVVSGGYTFGIDEVDLDRDTNSFIVKELFYDGNVYTSKDGTVVKNIVPRKVTKIDAHHDNISPSSVEGPHTNSDAE